MSCNQCHKPLPSDGDYVTCGRCNGEFHFECSIKKSTWKAKSQKSKSEWECSKCKSEKARTQSIDEDPECDEPTFQALKKLLERMFKAQEKIISEKVDNVVTVVSQLEEKFNGVCENLKKVETDTLNLKKDIEDLKLDLEMEKQYGRSRNFIVTSIPHSEKEDVGSKVISLLELLQIPLKREEITAHRLPSKSSPAPIIVQCMTRETRDSVVRKARKLKPKTSIISNSHPDRAIFFNDHLTPYFSSLMTKANDLKKARGYKYIWFNGNKIMVRKDNNSKAIQITKDKDLEAIV